MTESNLRMGGVVTCWSIGEWTFLDQLRKQLTDAGYEKYVPEIRTPAACLRDSLEDLFPAKDLMVRPLKTKDGFAVIRETRGEDANDYQPLSTARIDTQTLAITLRPYDWALADKLTDNFNRYRGLLKPGGVSGALVNIIDHLGGIRLRPGGAIYWLPGHQMPEWQRVIAAVEASGVEKPNAVYVIRHNLDADAIRAVKDAVCEQVTDSAVRLEAEVVKGDLGGRALKARQQLAEELRDKVKLYEEILGTGLSSLQSSLDTAEQAIAAAVILASCNTEPVAAAS